MNCKQKLETAMKLLDRAANRLADDTAPDTEWWKDLFLLTGEHMILTEEGWEPGSGKSLYVENEQEILDEVNVPGGHDDPSQA